MNTLGNRLFHNLFCQILKISVFNNLERVCLTALIIYIITVLVLLNLQEEKKLAFFDLFKKVENCQFMHEGNVWLYLVVLNAVENCSQVVSLDC